MDTSVTDKLQEELLNLKITLPPDWTGGTEEPERIMSAEKFIAISAGYMIRALLLAGKRNIVHDALNYYLEAIEELKPAEAQKLYSSYIKQFDI